ncbi:GNAT family N-acetyltransferase [Leadbettera azotonutricia]|uniref:N-acetyltransferase domain-containing protein n=1 Tax=Leadbettera azotonutricia (strain ATCC BAA-888 / DSM 13862 / ZAS-9) TaxID=545695 RepID=F5YF43_LEAAZ|nr:GNAT family N-acetyltransferase [Leadbettera azotonutricia]AEF81890.1 conserved hypothetical protein [Leadbettera azotonutricia ZAS-9]
MNITIDLVRKDEKEILRNLLEKYLYEFSQYEKTDVNSLGLYGYNYLDHYWTEDRRYPCFIKAENKLAGFAMVNDYPEVKIKADYTMSEFFILFKYRNSGIGKYAADYLFDKYKGKWQLKYHPKNTVSEKFWLHVVDDYTRGKYELLKDNPQAAYADGTLGNILIFDTPYIS